MATSVIVVAGVVTALSALSAAYLYIQLRRMRRADFIRDYALPPGLLDKLQAKRGFRRKESALVAEGLRQFFLAYLNSGKRYVAMPSQVADDLWTGARQIEDTHPFSFMGEAEEVADGVAFVPNMPTEDIELTWKLQKRFYDVRYEPRALVWMTVPTTSRSKRSAK